VNADRSSTDLDARLESLAGELAERAPLGADGAPAQIAALLAAEPAVGEVVVVGWIDADGNEQYELVRLADGSPVHDHTALREALTLLAMNETLEELASFGEVHGLADALKAWLDAAPAGTLSDLFIESVAAANAHLDALTKLDTAAAGAHLATTARLDQLSGVIRELEQVWERLEQQAELWSDQHLAATDNSAAAVAVVQDLWRLLGHARRGPLAQPVSSAIHGGREAGTALANAIAEASREA
jgi:outer membrane murein-binding lipoprotein Lpp